MSLTLTPLFEPTALSAGITTLFTSGANTRIDKLTISNPLGTVATVAVHLVPAGQLANQGNQIIPPWPIQPSQSWDADQVAGHVLGPGDSLRVNASVDNQLVAFGSGVQAS